MTPTIVTDDDLPHIALVVTTTTADGKVTDDLDARCEQLGIDPPPVLVVATPNHFQVVTHDDLRRIGVIALLVDPDDVDSPAVHQLVEQLQRQCDLIEIDPAPLLLVVTRSGNFETWAADADEARQIVDYLTARFGL